MLLALLLVLQEAPVDRLGHEDPEVRTRAETELRERGGEAIPSLFEGLGHPDAEVRGRCEGLLAAQSPLDWAPYFGDPRAQPRFLGSFRDPLVPDWRERASRFASAALQTPLPLRRFEEVARTCGHEVWTVGKLRRSDPDRAVVAWHQECPGGIGVRLQEGVFFVGYRPDLEALAPLPRFLVGRLLEEPGDSRAAGLLAQLVSEPGLRGLARAARRDDPAGRASFLVLTHVYAAGEGRMPDPAYGPAFRRRLEEADWDFVHVASLVARDHARALAPELRSAYRSANPWARYLAAATANLTKEPALYDPALFEIMRECRPELRKAALLSTAAFAPPGDMDFEAMFDAALAQAPESRWDALYALRRLPDPRFAAVLADAKGLDWDFAFQVLAVFDDDRFTDAFCDAVGKRLADPDADRSFGILAQYAGGGRRTRPVELLKRFAREASERVASQAVERLAGLLGEEALALFSSWLADRSPTVRRRGMEGLFQSGRLAPAGSCLREEFASALRAAVEREADSETAELGRSRLGWLGREDPPARYGGRIGGRRVLVVRSSCGSGDTRIGWRPLPGPAIPRPSW